VALAFDREVAAARRESDRAARIAEDVEQDMRRGERCVAAQIDFTDRREPAQIETVSRRTRNAVSERLFSSAIACMIRSSSQLSSGQTAAGLPSKARSAKASI